MQFTYETRDRLTPLETYEWDNVWWDHPEEKNALRAVYVGDSISCGTRSVLFEKYKQLRLDGFGTSKAVDHPSFQNSLHLFAMQTPKPSAVLFNNGLHGWHLDDNAYAEYYEDMVKFFLLEYPCVPLILLTTTFIADEARLERVKRRNEIVCKIAKKYNLTVGDLYQVSMQNKSLLTADGVHFSREGYEKLAQAVYGYLRLFMKI